MTRNCSIRTVAFLFLLIFRPTDGWPQDVIGVLGIASEIAPIERQLTDSREVVVRGYTFRRGVLDGRQVVVGRSGAGKVNAAIAATLMIDHFNVATVLFSGTAGAIDQSLKPGDVVIGTAVGQYDAGLQAPDGIRRRGLRNMVTGELDPVLAPTPDVLLAAARASLAGLTLPPVKTANSEHMPRIVEGVIVTADVFLADIRRREELRTSLGAAALEMEGGAVVQVCRQFRVGCLVVRSVTDYADGQALASYDQFFKTASENAATVVTRIIRGLK